MRREISRCRDQHMASSVGSFKYRILPKRSLDILDGMKVAIFAQQGFAKRREERACITTSAQIIRDQRAGLVHLLLAVEQIRQLGKPLLGNHLKPSRLGNFRSG